MKFGVGVLTVKKSYHCSIAWIFGSEKKKNLHGLKKGRWHGTKSFPSRSPSQLIVTLAFFEPPQKTIGAFGSIRCFSEKFSKKLGVKHFFR